MASPGRPNKKLPYSSLVSTPRQDAIKAARPRIDRREVLLRIWREKSSACLINIMLSKTYKSECLGLNLIILKEMQTNQPTAVAMAAVGVQGVKSGRDRENWPVGSSSINCTIAYALTIDNPCTQSTRTTMSTAVLAQLHMESHSSAQSVHCLPTTVGRHIYPQYEPCMTRSPFANRHLPYPA